MDEKTKAIGAIVQRLQQDVHSGYLPSHLVESFAKDEAAVLRFLRARQMDITKSHEMARIYLKWRDEVKPERICLADIKGELERESFFMMGKNLAGYPTFLMQTNKNDATCNPDKLEKMFIYAVEHEIKSLPSGLESFGIVLDLKGLSLRGSERDVEKRIFTIFQNYYPERLHKAYIINAPRLFIMGWKIIKSALAPETVEKIKFISKVQELQEHFNINELPPQYGGCSTRSFRTWYHELEREHSIPVSICDNKNIMAYPVIQTAISIAQ